MGWWDCSTNVLRCQGCLGGEAVGGEVFLNGGAKKRSIDQKFKWNGRGGVEKSVHQGGECISAEVWLAGVEMG